MLVVNLFSGPGGGKSTCAAGMFYFLKMRGINCELVTEFAKELTYDEIWNTYLDRQEVIFAEQNQRLHRLRKHVDVAITDSPLLLSYVYPKMNQQLRGVGEWKAFPEFKKFVVAQINTYENVNFLLSRNEKIFQSHGREHDLDESMLIDDAILQALVETETFFTDVNVNESLVPSLVAQVRVILNTEHETTGSSKEEQETG